MRKKRRIPAVNKSDIGFIAALLKINTDIEVTWKLKEIRLLSEQILVPWHRVKNAAKFTREIRNSPTNWKNCSYLDQL